MKLKVVYRLRVTEIVDSSDYDKENITLEEIQAWEESNLASLIGNPLGIPGEVAGKVEVSVVED